MYWELLKYLAEVCPPQACQFQGCTKRVRGRPSYCHRHIDAGFRKDFSALIAAQQEHVTYNIFATILRERLSDTTDPDAATVRECVELYRPYKAPHLPDFTPTPQQLRVILATFEQHRDDDDILNEVNRLTGKPMKIFEL